MLEGLKLKGNGLWMLRERDRERIAPKELAKRSWKKGDEKAVKERSNNYNDICSWNSFYSRIALRKAAPRPRSSAKRMGRRLSSARWLIPDSSSSNKRFDLTCPLSSFLLPYSARNVPQTREQEWRQPRFARTVCAGQAYVRRTRFARLRKIEIQGKHTELEAKLCYLQLNFRGEEEL